MSPAAPIAVRLARTPKPGPPTSVPDSVSLLLLPLVLLDPPLSAVESELVVPSVSPGRFVPLVIELDEVGPVCVVDDPALVEVAPLVVCADVLLSG